MEGCIKDFSVEVLEESGSDQSGYLKVKFSAKTDSGPFPSEIKEYYDTSGSTAQRKFSNDVSSFFLNHDWCESEPVESVPSEVEDADFLGIMRKQIDIMQKHNDLLADQTKAIRENTQSNAVSKAIKEQTVLQDFHSNYSTANNIVQRDKATYELYGDNDTIDSNGNNIIPVKASAHHNQEKAIETKSMNLTDFGEIALNFIGANDKSPFDHLIKMAKKESDELFKSTFNYKQVGDIK